MQMHASKKVTCNLGLLTWVLIVVVVELCVVSFQSEGHYLKASSRWLVREADGQRTKLACVNWAGHLETMLPEGLNRQPLYRLGLAVKGMGFNCVRLTFATHMFTHPTLSNLTVAQSFERMNLQHSLRGIAIHNPDLIHLPIQVAFASVVARLTRAGLLIIVDNHVSKPQWCCGSKDGNGFWGDTFFDAESWLHGLSAMAFLLKDNSEVVGMSLRNELRGPKQNTHDWYKYMSLGANAVHKANPNLIIILSGLRFDTDLRSVAKDHFANLPFQDKLVYEMHWYTSSYGTNFAKGNLNQACAIATSSIMKSGAFMTYASTLNGNFTAPLFISEFGIDQRGGNRGNNRFINCFFAFVGSMDLDWAYWPLQGNYYIRDGREGDEEFYGILNSQWSAPRNISFLSRLEAIQPPWKSGAENGSASRSELYQVLFHPATGLCVRKGSRNTLLLGPCMESTTGHWRYTPQGRLEMRDSYLCIASDGEGQFAKLATVGTEKNGPWTLASVANLQFATYINMSNDDAFFNSHLHSNAYHPNHPMFDLHHSHEEIHSLPNIDDRGNGYHDDNFGTNSDASHDDHDLHGHEYHDNQYDNDGDDDIDNVDNDCVNSEDDNNGDDDILDDIGSFHHRIGMRKAKLVATPQSIYHNPILCLDGSTPPFITTKRCICVQEDEMDCRQDDDPSPQWFILISTDKHPSTMEHHGVFKT